MKTIISIIVAMIFIGGAFFVTKNSNKQPKNSETPNEIYSDQNNNVNIVDGKQIIEIKAKGGYWPRITSAKANIPTILKINTQGTFDCSSALVISDLKYRKNLPPSGVTDIEIPPQPIGARITGMCSMGMYNFGIDFN